MDDSQAATNREIENWLSIRPGIFESASARGCYGKAFRDFDKRTKLISRRRRLFQGYLRRAGYIPRPIGFGYQLTLPMPILKHIGCRDTLTYLGY